jgi:hypothetical protein
MRAATRSSVTEAGSTAYMFNVQKCIWSNGKERWGSIRGRVHVTLFLPTKFANAFLSKMPSTPRKPRGGQGYTLLHSTVAHMYRQIQIYT